MYVFAHVLYRLLDSTERSNNIARNNIQAANLTCNLVSRLLGLVREILDFGRDDRKTASSLT